MCMCMQTMLVRNSPLQHTVVFCDASPDCQVVCNNSWHTPHIVSSRGATMYEKQRSEKANVGANESESHVSVLFHVLSLSK